MKRIYLLYLLAVLLLNSSCVAPEFPIAAATPMPKFTAPAPTPKATSRPTPEPTGEPASDSSEFAKRYCEEYGLDYQKEFDEAFRYAKETMPSDFSLIRPELPQNLYRHPYNVWADPQAMLEDSFQTNIECIEIYGMDWVMSIMEAARGFSRVLTNEDYTRTDEEALYNEIFYYAPPWTEDQEGYGTDYLAAIRQSEIIKTGTFVTDRGLVYQCEDGFFRVRGREFFKVSHAVDSYLKEHRIKLNTWYWADIEYMVLPHNQGDNWNYEHYKFSVYNWISIPDDGWKEADASMIALAEANMA